MNNEQFKSEKSRKESFYIAIGSVVIMLLCIIYMKLVYQPEIHSVVTKQQQTIDSLKAENDGLTKAVHMMSAWGYIRDNGTGRDIHNTILEDKRERVQLQKNSK